MLLYQQQTAAYVRQGAAQGLHPPAVARVVLVVRRERPNLTLLVQRAESAPVGLRADRVGDASANERSSRR